MFSTRRLIRTDGVDFHADVERLLSASKRTLDNWAIGIQQCLVTHIVVNLARFVKRDVSRSLFWSISFGGLLALSAILGDDPPELSASQWTVLFVQFFTVVMALRYFYYLFLYRNIEANTSEQFREKYDHFIADNKVKWW